MRDWDGFAALFFGFGVVVIGLCVYLVLLPEQTEADRRLLGHKPDSVYIIDAKSGRCVQIDLRGKYTNAINLPADACRRQE